MVSKHDAFEQYIWESAAGGSFAMHGEVKRGTNIICYLKEVQPQSLEECSRSGKRKNGREFKDVKLSHK